MGGTSDCSPETNHYNEIALYNGNVMECIEYGVSMANFDYGNTTPKKGCDLCTGGFAFPSEEAKQSGCPAFYYYDLGCDCLCGGDLACDVATREQVANPNDPSAQWVYCDYDGDDFAMPEDFEGANYCDLCAAGKKRGEGERKFGSIHGKKSGRMEQQKSEAEAKVG